MIDRWLRRPSHGPRAPRPLRLRSAGSSTRRLPIRVRPAPSARRRRCRASSRSVRPRPPPGRGRTAAERRARGAHAQPDAVADGGQRDDSDRDRGLARGERGRLGHARDPAVEMEGEDARRASPLARARTPRRRRPGSAATWSRRRLRACARRTRRSSRRTARRRASRGSARARRRARRPRPARRASSSRCRARRAQLGSSSSGWPRRWAMTKRDATTPTVAQFATKSAALGSRAP